MVPKLIGKGFGRRRAEVDLRCVEHDPGRGAVASISPAMRWVIADQAGPRLAITRRCCLHRYVGRNTRATIWFALSSVISMYWYCKYRAQQISVLE